MRSLPTSVGVLTVLGCSLLGCGEEAPGVPRDGRDAGWRSGDGGDVVRPPEADGSVADAGSPGADAGSPGADAGSPGADAGSPGADAGPGTGDASAGQSDPRLYFMQGTEIWRVDLDGTDAERVLDTGEDWVEDLAGDPQGGRIYWVETGEGAIRSATYEGADRRLVADTNDPNTDLAFDVGGRHLYWIIGGLFNHDGLFRAAPDGSNVTELGAVSEPSALALDPAEGRIYMGSAGGALLRVDLDGTNPKTDPLEAGRSSTVDVELDPVGGWVYWLSLRTLVGSASTISRGRLDRTAASLAVTDIEELVSGRTREQGQSSLPQPTEVALDVAGRSLYWAVEVSFDEHEIWRARLDGTDRQRIFTATGNHLELSLAVLAEP